MSIKEKLVQGVNDGVSTINEKIEQQKAAARKRERRKKLKKAFYTMVNILLVPLVLGGLVWMAAELFFDYQPELISISSGWTLVLALAAALSMITLRLIPVKVGVILLSGLILIRNNGWLWGVLGAIPLYYIAIAVAVLVALIYIITAIVRVKTGAKRQWKKAKKTVTKKVDHIRSKLTKSK